MSSYVNAFLKTEITCIPQVLDRYIGKYYSNKLCNASLWLIVIWNILHCTFDACVNALLRKMYFKEYIRIRLKYSLWYLGFYGCSASYCAATIFKHDIELLNYKKFNSLDPNEPLLGSVFTGYMLLSTFYAHCMFWEALQSSVVALNYLFLTMFVIATYYLRCVELTIALTAIVGLVKCQTEITRCLCTLIKSDSSTTRYLTWTSYFVCVGSFIVIYLIVIPLSFVVPIMYNTVWSNNTIMVTILNVSLWLWLTAEIYNSVLFKFIRHLLYHNKDRDRKLNCAIMECTLFKPRDDMAYHIKIIREEIKERQAKMMALRKPRKGANMLVQTLKCMAAINRKIKMRRMSENAQTDDSEKSESEPDLSQDSKEDTEDKSSNASSSDDEVSDFEEDNQSETRTEDKCNIIEGKLSVQYTEDAGKLKTMEVIEKSSYTAQPEDSPASDSSGTEQNYEDVNDNISVEEDVVEDDQKVDSKNTNSEDL